MLFLTEVAGFAIKEVLESGSGSLLGMLTNRVSDHGQRVTKAVQLASTSAWRALEISLAGESLWTRLDRAEDKGFRERVRAYLEAMPLPLLMGKNEFRRVCLRELKMARKDPDLAAPLTQEGLADRAGTLAQYASPQAMIGVEVETMRAMAERLKKQGFSSLAWLFEQEAQPNESVLVIAVRYYFRRRVEADAVLARTIQFSQLESLGQEQKTHFDHLETLLETHSVRLDEALEGLVVIVGEARDAAVGAQQAATGAHSAVLDLSAEMQAHMAGMSEQVRALYAPVMQLLASLNAGNEPVNPRLSVSIRTDKEKELVHTLLRQYRELPEDQQRSAPALLNGIGKLEVAVGDFDDAQETFERVATLTHDSGAKAEAHFNAYQAALEAGDFADALEELTNAIEADPETFSPFPWDDYEAVKILGAGGFGVTFLCKHKLYGGEIAVKALLVDDLDRDVLEVFQEAQALDQLEHSAIIRLRHCGFADSGRKRPYLVMDYFEGPTLEDYVGRHGELSVKEFYPLACKLADALGAAHAKGILHRDIKPANILVRRNGDDWEIRIIDFGLALKQEVLGNATSTLRRGHTITSGSIAGTIEYAAPEQMGKIVGAKIGTPADVFGFARTCCFALFGVAETTFQHWQQLPQPLAELLGECLNQQPENRPSSFPRLLQRLESMSAKSGGPPPIQLEEAGLPNLVLEIPDEADVVSPPPAQVVPPVATVVPPVQEVEPAIPEGRLLPDPDELPEADPIEPPRRQRRRRYQHRRDDRDEYDWDELRDARKKLQSPAVLMLLLGLTISGVFGLASLGFSVTPGPDYEYGMFSIALTMCGLVAIAGAIAMMRAQWYPVALSGAIAISLGGCICFFVGPLIGIWSISVLSRDDVKAAFD